MRELVWEGDPDPDLTIREDDAVGTFRYKGQPVRPAYGSDPRDWSRIIGTPYEVWWPGWNVNDPSIYLRLVRPAAVLSADHAGQPTWSGRDGTES